MISRPCVAAHKLNITVAAIEKYVAGIPAEVKSFDQALDFLESLRGGIGSPDLLYLGGISGFSGRFAARLDSLHTIQMPSDIDERNAFFHNRRIGRLHVDFARDLHVRLFCAFAALGFDDVGWYSTDDLQWLIAKARSELSGAEKNFFDKRAADAQRSFQGKSLPTKEIADAENRVNELRAKLLPLENEIARRGGA